MGETEKRERRRSKRDKGAKEIYLYERFKQEAIEEQERERQRCESNRGARQRQE